MIVSGRVVRLGDLPGSSEFRRKFRTEVPASARMHLLYGQISNQLEGADAFEGSRLLSCSKSQLMETQRLESLQDNGVFDM